MNSTSILLIGATGLVGNEILKLLHRDQLFNEIIILTRREIPGFSDDKRIRQIIADFSRLEDYKEHIKAYYIVSTLGTTIKKAGTKENFRKIDYLYTLKTAELALQNGASHFLLVSSLGANDSSRIFYNRVKGEIEKAVSALPFKSVSIFRPSILSGKRDEFRIGEVFGRSLMKAFSFMVPVKYQPTEAYQLAEVILHTARKDQPGKKIYEADEIRELYYDQL